MGQIATQWYTTIEIFFGGGRYSPPIDIWAMGFIFGELVTGKMYIQKTS
jgi:serine/threonine protein kinase